MKSRIITAMAAAVLAVGLSACTAAAPAPQDTEEAASTSTPTPTDEPTSWFDQQGVDDEPAAEMTPEPVFPEPDGTYRYHCDYLLDPYRFVADVSVKNTGNIGTVDEVRAVWRLAGGGKVARTKKVRSEPGERRRVSFNVPTDIDTILAHQSYGLGDECKVKVTTINTFGEPQG